MDDSGIIWGDFTDRHRVVSADRMDGDIPERDDEAEIIYGIMTFGEEMENGRAPDRDG